MNIEWINPYDNKPEAEKEVLLLCKVKNSNNLYKCIGFYEPLGMLRDDSDFNWDYECCDEYDEDHDDYLVNSGWYERIYNWDDYSAIWIEDEVIGWADISDEDNGGDIANNKENQYYAGKSEAVLFNEQDEIIRTVQIDMQNFCFDKHGKLIENGVQKEVAEW